MSDEGRKRGWQRRGRVCGEGEGDFGGGAEPDDGCVQLGRGLAPMRTRTTKTYSHDHGRDAYPPGMAGVEATFDGCFVGRCGGELVGEGLDAGGRGAGERHSYGERKLCSSSV